MSAMLDQLLTPTQMADCERADRELNAHVHPTMAQVLNSFATFGPTHSGPAAVFSPADVHAALLQLESGLADWISAADRTTQEIALGVAVSRELERVVDEVGERIDGSAA